MALPRTAAPLETVRWSGDRTLVEPALEPLLVEWLIAEVGAQSLRVLVGGCAPVGARNVQRWRSADLPTDVVRDPDWHNGDVIDESAEHPQCAELHGESMSVVIAAAAMHTWSPDSSSSPGAPAAEPVIELLEAQESARAGAIASG
jgi:hypothetical protein